ncbi:hypothetical protein JCM21900_000128 [Sporobolomyces salmonicolor]
MDSAPTDFLSSASATATDSSDLFGPTPWIPPFSSSDAVPTSSDLTPSAAVTSGSTAADLTVTESSSLSASSSAASSSIDELSSPTFGPSVSTVVSAFTTLTVSGTDQPAYTTLFVTAPASFSSPSLQPATTNSGSQLSSARAGAIAGGVIGGVAFLAIALAFFFCIARRRGSTEEDEGEEIRWPEMRDRAAGFYVARTRPTGRAGFAADEEGEEAAARSEETYVLPHARSTSPFQSLFYHQPAQPGASAVPSNLPASTTTTHPSTPQALPFSTKGLPSTPYFSSAPHLQSSSEGHGTEESTFYEGKEGQLLEPEERQQVYSGTGTDRSRRKLSVVNKDVDEE